MFFLRKLWGNEHQKMSISLSKVKNKTKKQKDFMDKVRSIPDSIRDAILQKYMDKCKYQNAIEFIDWYKKVYGEKPGDRSVVQKVGIALRMTMLRKAENNLYHNTDEIMSREFKNVEEMNDNSIEFLKPNKSKKQNIGINAS